MPRPWPTSGAISRRSSRRCRLACASLRTPGLGRHLRRNSSSSAPAAAAAPPDLPAARWLMASSGLFVHGQSGEADGEADGDMRAQRIEWAFYATQVVRQTFPHTRTHTDTPTRFTQRCYDRPDALQCNITPGRRNATDNLQCTQQHAPLQTTCSAQNATYRLQHAPYFCNMQRCSAACSVRSATGAAPRRRPARAAQRKGARADQHGAAHALHRAIMLYKCSIMSCAMRCSAYHRRLQLQYNG